MLESCRSSERTALGELLKDIYSALWIGVVGYRALGADLDAIFPTRQDASIL